MNKLLIILVSVFYLSSLITADEKANTPPNIIVIVVDDLGYADMSHTAMASDVSTPNIDALAEAGVRFTNAYATAPICNASRIAIMTGSYQQRQGVYWYGGPGLHGAKFTTIAESLKEKGYATGLVGKFHHGKTDHINGRGFPLNHGFDFFYGFSGGTKHYLHHSDSYQDRNLHEGAMYVQKEKKNVEGFTTELFGEQARSFINKNKDKSFYLHLSFNAVHNFTHQLPESYLKEKGLKGFADNESKETYWQWRQKIGYPAHPEGRDYYLGQLYFLDREIGLVMKQLDELKLTDNTAVFFISDNGGSLVTYANNGELNGGKYTLFEGGNRVPLIIKYPRLNSTTKVIDSVTSTMDLYPTICSLVKAEIPSHLDGINLLPILSAKGEIKKRTLFWDTKYQEALRRGKWKYIKTNKTPNKRLQITETPTGEFLYNLELDPGETKNLATLYPDLVSDMKLALKKWQEEIKNK
ncbi:sulfatase-like hydrolase/transferase [Lentisphaera profundi]|uniref:Sulfatase-like hydrolase/transferase n=1 Tax=Lentisphaera profundi TaxID=1658616 RepID=A0ABY7W0L4_9BACT|nr:sulfatase-like hydrolase/transferase [Lentisphaera profundi]WDE98965.1 sulfatase-like hydrolase/transferase [Lentisphaera profundi]